MITTKLMISARPFLCIAAFCAITAMAQDMQEPAPLQRMELTSNLGLPDQDFNTVLQNRMQNDRMAPVNSLLILLRQKLPQDQHAKAVISRVDALNTYQQGDYDKARSLLQHLMQYGSAHAMSLLSTMAEQGQGQTADKVQALSYLYVASGYPLPGAKARVLELEQGLSAAEQADAKAQATTLLANLKIKRQKHYNDRHIIERGRISLSRRVLKDSLFGYVKGRQLIGRDGKVLVVELTDSMPEGLFESAAINGISRNRYNPSEKASIYSFFSNVTFGPGIHVQKFTELLQQDNLWRNASQGNPSAQYQLARLMQLAEARAISSYSDLEQLELQLFEPDFRQLIGGLTAEAIFPNFEGQVELTLDDNGIVSEVNRINRSHLKPEDLLGHSFGLPAGRYRLTKPQGRGIGDYIFITQQNPVAERYRGEFWLQQAAESGYLPAQQTLSTYNTTNGWLSYLAQQQDPASLAWFGAQQIIDGQKTEGMANIDKAISLGYGVGKQLKAALKDY